METTQVVLDIQSVSKRYDKHIAVDNLSFTVKPGILFGLLGPNGAGKTSTIRMITGITLPDQGYISLNGKKVDGRLSRKIGYLPEERGLYKKMTVGEHLIYLIRLRGWNKKEGKAKVMEWLERFEIDSWWDKKIEELSKGMQQKVQFIATVMHEPELLILDEPFSGLDPVNSRLVQKEIIRLSQEGCGVILSTHRMEQVEELCDEIVVVNHGAKILEGPIADVKMRHWDGEYLLGIGEPPEPFLPESVDVIRQAKKNLWEVRLDESVSASQLLQHLIKEEKQITHFEKSLPSLNEIFIQVTGEQNPQIA
jgi:ABC-2 type transport system ATP-binding protein